MASTIPNERTLRKITIAALIPAFPLLVASGVMSERATGGVYYHGYYNYRSGPTLIYFGLLPVFFSAITSIIYLQSKHDPLDKRPRWHAPLWFLIDAFLAAGNLAVLIPVWMIDPPSLGAHGDWVMLETYATVFLLAEMFIHGYLALYQTFKALLNNPLKALARKLYARGAVTECPHCHHNIRTVEATGGKREGYSLLRAENYLDEPEAEAEAEASHGVIRLSDDSEVSQV